MSEINQVILEIPYGDGSVRSVTISDDPEAMQDEALLSFLAAEPKYDTQLPEGILKGVLKIREHLSIAPEQPKEEAQE